LWARFTRPSDEKQVTPKLRRTLVLTSIITATFMISIEATIVSTAMPQITTHIGTNLRLYSWVFSAFLLAQTVTTPVFGSLADTFGRRPILLIGTTMFLLASLLCGLAWSMTSLIAFRFLQGLACGAIQPVTQTLIGDMYTGLERGRAQGYLGAAWGISSILGPLAGALIVQHLHWAWIFWINLPVGAVAGLGFYFFVRESVDAERRSVDVLGAGLFMISVAALMLALNSFTGDDRAEQLACGAVLILSAVLFVVRERAIREPMLPFELLQRRPLGTLNVLSLLFGAVMIGTITFLPVYVQVVMARSPLTAGFALTAQVLGWTISSMVATPVFQRLGLGQTLVIGAALFPLGAVPLVAMSPASEPMWAGLGSLTLGLGMGFVNTAAMVIVQGTVGWAERGSATSLYILSRNLGSAVGATALGAIMNIYLNRSGSTAALSNLRALLESPRGSTAAAVARNELHGALHLVFWAVLLLSLPILLLAIRDRRYSPSEMLDEAL
jgi:EmrB/QacA subfamily drug resistance transporter